MPNRAEQIASRDQLLYGFLEALDCGNSLTIVGIDEVGRGSLSGPLSVAAVVLPLTPRISGLNDSKKLTATQREELAEQIKEIAKTYSIIDIEPLVIDSIGIAKAVRKAMEEALAVVVASVGEPDIVLVDGKPLGIHAHEQAIIKGDGKVACIAAASILAKTHRDVLMVDYSRDFPHYDWQSNKGYGTAAHIAALKEQGLTPLHRRSFCRGILQESLF